jgi:flagella basal body P-ring formation protein FlgA
MTMTQTITTSLGALAAGLALALTAAALPAFAGTPVELNPTIVDATGQVTLGEIFDNAGPARDVVVAQRAGPTVVLDAVSVQTMARRYGLDWDNPRGITRIIVRSGAGVGGAGRNEEVLTWAHNVATGEIVRADDLIWAKAAAIPYDAPGRVDSLIGMAARHPLREGDAALTHDVSAPIAVKIGDTVLVSYTDDGVTLTLDGKAMASAAVGETFNVLNPASKKLIEAVASGADQGVVGPEAMSLRANSQMATR